MKHSSGAPFLPMLVGHVLIGTTLGSMIVIVLFFTYVSSFAYKFADSQVDVIARSLADDISLWIPSSTAAALVDNIQVGGEEDDERSKGASKMRKSVYVALGIAMATVAILAIPLVVYMPGEQLIATNAVLSGTAGLAFFAFFEMFVRDYVLVDPNYIRNLTINSFLLKLAKNS